MDHDAHDHIHGTSDHGNFHPNDQGHHHDEENRGRWGHDDHGNHDNNHNDDHHNNRGLHYEHDHSYPAPVHQSAYLPMFSPPQRELAMFQVEHLHADDIYHHHQHHDDHHNHNQHDTGHRRTIPMVGSNPATIQWIQSGRQNQQIGNFMKKMLTSYNIELVPSLPLRIAVE